MQLVFIGDPMCSWCYGFGKELSKLMSALPDAKLDIVVGGVRAGATDILDDAGKQFRLSHWARVEEASGLPFNRAAFTALKGFVYNTEPVCRAVVTARRIAPQAPLLDVFRALQHAFYADGRDTTSADVLSAVVASSLTIAGHVVSTEDVRKVYDDPATIQETQADFNKCRNWGVSGFPVLVLVTPSGQRQFVSSGYMKAEQMLQRLRPVMQTA